MALFRNDIKILEDTVNDILRTEKIINDNHKKIEDKFIACDELITNLRECAEWLEEQKKNFRS